MNPTPLLPSILRRLSAPALGLAFAAMAQPATADVVWSENFESAAALTNWSVSNGTWQIGIPTSGPGVAHGGLRCAATVLDGNYSPNANTRLQGPLFTVPAASENPRLQFWHWYNFSTSESAVVYLYVDGAWVPISGNYANVVNGRGWTPAWARPEFDLSAYAGKTVRLGFGFYSDNNSVTVGPGWYIDDIQVITGALPVFSNPETFEDSAATDRWTADYGMWEIGAPTSGPGAAHGGTTCLATNLTGSYPHTQSSVVRGPLFTVPAASENPRLRFWHWYNFSTSETARVYLYVDGAWVLISGNYATVASGYGWTPAWARPEFDLSAYSGKTVRLGFYFYSDNNSVTVGSGWYIDDIQVITGALPVFSSPETFEDSAATDRWTADYGMWEIGAPTSGPGAAHGGTTCLATNLTGSYPYNQSSRVRSSLFTVPAASENPRLRFWHWWSMSTSDSGKVQVSIDNGATWTDLSGQYVGSGGGVWSRPEFNLSSYAGKTVRLGFYFYSDNNSSTVGSGWYIDDVRIEVTSLNAADFPNRTVVENHPLTITTSTTLANPVFSLMAGAPVGMMIDPTSGRIDWTPSEAQGPGYYPVTVELRQAGNNLEPVASASFEVQVLEANNAPVLPVLAPQSADVNTQFTFDVNGTDPDSANRTNRNLISRADFEDLTLGVWTPYSVASNKNWIATEYDGRYAEMFGYAANVASEDWLISPVLNLDQYTGESLSFLSRWQYTGPALEVLYSTNYSGSGNPNAATWTSLTAACTWPIVSNDWAASGTVNLGGISGSAVYLAFRYKSTGTTNSTGKQWQLDNIELIGTPVAVINNTDVITYSLGAGTPSGMSIDPASGVVTWTPTSTHSNLHFDVEIIATDNGGLRNDNGGDKGWLHIDVSGNNSPPTWPLPLPAPAAVDEGGLVTFTATASDLDNDVITYSLAPGAPAGMSIHPSTGVVTWQTDEGDDGSHAVTILADDPTHDPVPTPVPVMVTVNELNLPPTLPAISDREVNEQVALSFRVLATDDDLAPNPLTFSLEAGAPAGATINPSTGVFLWTPTEGQGPGQYPITVKVTDSSPTAVNATSLFATRTFTVRVTEVNRAPVLGVIAPLMPVAGGTQVSFTATAADPDVPVNTLAYALASGAPPGATIHPLTGVFTWTTPVVSMTETFSVTVIVTDNGSPVRDDRKTVAVTVMDDHDSWQRSKFGADVDNPAKEATVWGDHADPDRDGTPNILEFMMVRNPLVSDAHLGPEFRLENGKAIMSYRETKLANHGVFLLGNWSADLRSWFYGGLEYAVVEDRGDHNLVEIRMPVDRQQRLLLRLEAYRAY
ncbi:MAG: putative Ig domain-containing protein [Verrucomicrobia bacterium]|nr:putative Ig domain-containing protein [Verrucomicrobiota bacterium]